MKKKGIVRFIRKLLFVAYMYYFVAFIGFFGSYELGKVTLKVMLGNYLVIGVLFLVTFLVRNILARWIKVDPREDWCDEDYFF